MTGGAENGSVIVHGRRALEHDLANVGLETMDHLNLSRVSFLGIGIQGKPFSLGRNAVSGGRVSAMRALDEGKTSRSARGRHLVRRILTNAPCFFLGPSFFQTYLSL